MLLLLVEDNPGDARLFELASGRLGDDRTIRLAVDGAEALQAIADPDFRPDLIVLDLNLPWLSGEEFLREVKSHPETRNIPVFVLSGSTSPEHIQGCLALEACGFIPKPSTWNEWKRVVDNCWARVAPPPEPPVAIHKRLATELRNFVTSRAN